MAIQKLNAISEITALPKLQTIQPLEAVPKITALPSLTKQNTSQNFYADYSDPYELNSFADAILNTEAIKKASQDWGWFNWVGAVPILREIGAVIDVAWNKGIQPALAGDWKAVGVNTLINLGETTGVAGNVVKGLFMGGAQGAWNALGLWNSAGRTNYDWDTGSWVADLGLEIITDPLTWITFGTSAAVSTGAKAASKKALDATTKQISTWAARTIAHRTGEDVALNTARTNAERIAKKVSKTASRTLVDYVTGTVQTEANKLIRKAKRKGLKLTQEDTIKEILSNRTTQLKNLIINELIKDLPEKAKAILKDTTSKFRTDLERRLDSILNSLNWDILAQQINKTTQRLYKNTQSFEKFLFQSTLYTSGLGLTYKAFKPLLRPAGEFINNTILRNLRKAKYLSAQNIVDLKNYTKARAVYSESYKAAKLIDSSVERSEDTFLRLVNNQLRTDRAQFEQIAYKTRNKPAVRTRALNNYVRQKYQISSFADYVALIKEINLLENNFYSGHLQYLNILKTRMERIIPLQQLLKRTALRGIEQLFPERTVVQSQKNYKRTLENAFKIVQKNSSTPPHAQVIRYCADTIYQQIKYNELYRQVQLLKQPELYQLISDIANGSERTIGAFIKNILADPRAYSTRLYEIAQILNNTALNLKAFDDFVTDLYNGIYTKIERVSEKEFKETLLDILYSFGSTKAIDIVTNANAFGNLLKLKLEEVFNAKLKTGVKNRIYIPIENIIIIIEQCSRYAEILAARNPESLLFYPLDTNFTKTLHEFRKIAKQNSLDTTQLDKSFSAILNVYFQIRNFNSQQAILKKNIFEENKTTLATYDLGPTTLIESLTDGVEGAALYSTKQVLDTTDFKKYFNLIENAEYSVNFMQKLSTFLKSIKQVNSRINDTALKQYCERTAYPINLTQVLKIFQDNISRLYKKNETNIALEFLTSLQKASMFTPAEQLSILNALWKIDSGVLISKMMPFLKEQVKNTNSLKRLLQLIKQPQKVFNKPPVSAFNPQYILKNINEINFSDAAQQTFKELSKVCDTPLVQSEAFTSFTQALKNTTLAQECSEKNKIYNAFNTNVLNYTKNKINSLYDSKSVPRILEAYTALNPDPEILDLLRRFYDLSDILTNAEYTKLIQFANSPFVTKRIRTNLRKQFKIPAKLTPEIQSSKNYMKFKNALEKLDIHYPYRHIIKYNQQLRDAQSKIYKQQTLNFLSLTPEDMLVELAFRARTGVILDNSLNLKSKHVQSVMKQFNQKIPELKKLGIEVYQDSDTKLIYIWISKKHRIEYLDTRVFLDGRELIRKTAHLDYSVFKSFDMHLYNEFSKLEPDIEKLTGFNPYSSTGEVMDKDLLTHIYNGFDDSTYTELTANARAMGSDIQYYKGLPDVVKNDLPELDEILNSGFFNVPRFNDAILGSTYTHRRIQPYTGSTPILNAKNTLEQIGIFVQPKYEYINNIFDPLFSISEGCFKGYTDAQILEGLLKTNGQYRLITLVADKKYGMRIREIYPVNTAAIAEGRKLHAVVVPYSIYTKMINTVNHRIGGSGFFKLWNRIMYLYKFGYLMNIGTIARNWIDTNLKTDLELTTEARGFKRMARDYIKQFKLIQQRVAEMNDGLVTRKGIERYFAGEYPTTGHTIDLDTYFMLEDFFRYGPVTNIAQEPNLMNTGNGDLWRTFTDKAGAIMSAANWTEASNRLAIYLADLNRGIAKHEAWAHISKVHFDYAFKTPTEQLLESIFPFSTFMFRNIEYWVDTLEKHPEYIGLFRDIYTPIWNFDERTPEQLNASWALQYQIINGSISLFETDTTDYVLRISPSILDALETIVNPLTLIQNKLAAPISDTLNVLIGDSTPDIEMLPVIGTLYQRLNKMRNEQNILPSLVTKRKTTPTTSNYKMWRNSNLNNYNGIENTSNPYYVLPKTRMDSRIDPLRTIGVRAFTSRMMAAPKVKVKTDVYAKVYYKHHIDVYSGIRYQLKLNINKFR